MAKVFTIEFIYKAISYPALITVRSEGNEHSVFAHVTDKSVHHLLPEGELHFRITNGARRPAVTESFSGDKRILVQSIREEVIKFLRRPALPDPY